MHGLLRVPAPPLASLIGPAAPAHRAGLLLISFGMTARTYYTPRPDGTAPVPVEEVTLPGVVSRDGPGIPGEPVPGGGDAGGPRARAPLDELQRERLKLSQRVILHLASQGRLYDEEIATPAFTQGGMSEVLGVGQSPLSNVLRRLVVGAVLSEDVRHVRGRPKRLRVYRLTPMGEALAAEIRRQKSRSAPMGTPGVPAAMIQR